MSVHIRDGIEYRTPTAPMTTGGPEIRCARCGGAVEFLSCAECEGTGHGDSMRCQECKGIGGVFRCAQSYQWCTENPLPKRARIESTSKVDPARSDAGGEL